jgi:two-component system phosphate regulon sensor histidine kinase PhoR
MQDGVMLLDAEDKIVFANEALAKIFSIPRADLIAKRPLEAVRLVELAELIEEVKIAKGLREKEMKMVFPQEKNLLASANIIDNGVAIIVRDISEVKKLENLRSEFVANVSHELKTPLTAIRSYAETLLNGAVDDPKANRQFLEKIEKNAQNLSALIDDILEISRLEARRGIAPFETVHLEEEVDRAIETLSSKIREKKVEIVKQGKPGACEVQGEPNHIYRALINLLDNAIKYSDPGGRIEISCAGGDRELRLSVRDYGIGIPQEHHSRIFERFYRVDKARSRELGGTGLGLSIVKHIMEVHGGRVTLESAAGRGSKFTLIFPLQ